MKFKLDENLPVELADDLRGLGHDADTVVSEGLRGAPDPVVVEAARAADRVLLTLDKGIANVVRYPAHGHARNAASGPIDGGRPFANPGPIGYLRPSSNILSAVFSVPSVPLR